LFHCDYKIGDLVLFRQNVEWENVSCVEGEIGIVIEIIDPDDPNNFFDLLVQLGDGGSVPVWCGEIEILDNEQDI
jgi:ATP-dependent exoDNAse (exonuclease V) alpha subunit